jgi:hypothetical protein
MKNWQINNKNCKNKLFLLNVYNIMSSPFNIKSINIFSSWVYNLPTNTECTICRCNLNTTSLYNQEKGRDSFVVTGVCQHSFHEDCISPWVQKNNFCPICSQVWIYQSKLTNNCDDIKQNLNKKIIINK